MILILCNADNTQMYVPIRFTDPEYWDHSEILILPLSIILLGLCYHVFITLLIYYMYNIITYVTYYKSVLWMEVENA